MWQKSVVDRVGAGDSAILGPAVAFDFERKWARSNPSSSSGEVKAVSGAQECAFSDEGSDEANADKGTGGNGTATK